MQPPFVLGSLPEYEDSKLIVKMKPIAGTSLSATLAAARADAGAGLRGVSALSFYERAGMIRKVVPIVRRRSRARVASAFAAAGLARADAISATTLPEALIFGEASALSGSGLEAAAAATLIATAPSFDQSATGEGFNVIELDASADVRQLQLALAGDPAIASVALVPRRYLLARKPNAAKENQGALAAPPQTSTLWNLQKIRWAQARALSTFRDADAIKVAVLDTGIDVDHPDLRSQIGFYEHDHPSLPQTSSPKDVAGHGTHVGGTIAAGIANAIGVNGVCRCELHIWKIFDDQPELFRSQGSAYYAIAVDDLMYRGALLECADASVDVVNLSIGGPGLPDPLERDAFADLVAGGTTVVAAMGNERQYGSPTSYPAAIPEVIAVGATGINDHVTEFSNRGSHIWLSAPGDGIWSTTPTYAGASHWDAVLDSGGRWRPGQAHPRDIDYGSWDGTSMASPHVAAAVALLLANKGRLSPQQVREALRDSCDKVPAMNGAAFDADYGYGRLNLERLLA